MIMLLFAILCFRPTFAASGGGPCGPLFKLADVSIRVFNPDETSDADAFKHLNVEYLEGYTALDHARALGARRIVLDTNSSLRAAITLYESLGFKRMARPRGIYHTADVAMELIWSDHD